VIGKCIIAFGIHTGANRDEKAKHSMIPISHGLSWKSKTKILKVHFRTSLKQKRNCRWVVMIEKKASGAMTNEEFEGCIRAWCMFTYKKKIKS
jgi:hypothetical protein